MSVSYPIVGPPGAQTPVRVTFRRIFESAAAYLQLPGGVFIDGTKSRDPENSPNVNVLQPGVLMGMITATKLYAPSIIGVVQTAYTTGGTTLNVTAAQAVEFQRRLGSSGTATAYVVGPPTAAGTVATTAMTWSAVNTTTGDITITSLGVDKVAGSFLCAADGSQVPLSFIPDGSGILVTDQNGASVSLVQWSQIPIAGVIATYLSGPSTGIINWPTDTSLITYLQNALSNASGGKFIFMTTYGH